MTTSTSAHWRSIAIVGPYQSGKSTLLESLLFVTGAISRKGAVEDGNSVADGTAEARARQMGVEVNAAFAEYQGVQLSFLDCPGSIEFAQETWNALIGVDAAIVVCEPEATRALTVAPLLKFLDDWQIPHGLFINKMDRASTPLKEVLAALQSISSRPLALRQFPIGQGDRLSGFIDLVSEQAWQYHVGGPPDPIVLPEIYRSDEQAARAELLEVLAEFDDHLLEELVEEIEPPEAEIRSDLKRDLEDDLIVPVFCGVALRDFGVRPLLAALLSEVPEAACSARHRGIAAIGGPPVAQVLKTFYSPQSGKLSLVRIWRGVLADGAQINGARLAGLYRLCGQQQTALAAAGPGEIVALGRLEGIKTGDTLALGLQETPLARCAPLTPVFALAIFPEKRADEVKFSAAVAKLLEEDPSLSWEQNSSTREVVLWGQGEIHLQVALDRLRRKYNLPMQSRPPQVPYRETIRRAWSSHGRYKHQTGGHGQFGDVYLDIRPLARGEGFQFAETIVGGAVPRQYIPGVETGVREALERGPLGYPVVDVAVTLTNGSYHTVDSSEQAFKQAARIAMHEGLPRCEPVLLEPIVELDVSVPVEFTARALRLLSGKRGQILHYQGDGERRDWDCINAFLPLAQMNEFAVELRSLSLGVGCFAWRPAHLQEVPEKLAERLLART
ncbi:MAG: elongation factor G [Aphanocapsa lilacina HA4352-LM1]|jgi:elongation factor G|nr:elongation factor G [Aphanocapsa lilacina HA4352-LM1]